MTLALLAAVAAGASAEPAAVVRQLLDGWREADSAKARATWATDFRLFTLRKEGAGKRLEQDTPESLAKSMASLKPGDWDVRLGDAVIHQDESGIAALWAPYTFYMSGKKSHCGIESYTLYRFNEGWKVIQFADTHLWNGTEAQCVDRQPAAG